MLAPAPQTRIGMMIVGAGFLYFVTEGLLWLEVYFAINS